MIVGLSDERREADDLAGAGRRRLASQSQYWATTSRGIGLETSLPTEKDWALTVSDATCLT